MIRDDSAGVFSRENPMGGKRPDQVYIDPREAGATDYKTRTDDEHIHEEDKRAIKQPRGNLGIPKRGENPALGAVKRRKRGRGGKG